MQNQVDEKAHLKEAANIVFRQLTENPDLEIALDPDVADYMGAFEETALDSKDILDDMEEVGDE